MSLVWTIGLESLKCLDGADEVDSFAGFHCPIVSSVVMVPQAQTFIKLGALELFEDLWPFRAGQAPNGRGSGDTPHRRYAGMSCSLEYQIRCQRFTFAGNSWLRSPLRALRGDSEG